MPLTLASLSSQALTARELEVALGALEDRAVALEARGDPGLGLVLHQRAEVRTRYLEVLVQIEALLREARLAATPEPPERSWPLGALTTAVELIEGEEASHARVDE